MIDKDLSRIEARLGIALPPAYRDLMLTRAKELRGYTVQVQGQPRGWFEDTLYLDARDVIAANLLEREPDAGTAYAFPGWWKTFFLVGTDGAGGYYCLRLKGDAKVWMIGSDCDDVPTKAYDSLAKLVEAELREHAKETRRQARPAPSSFGKGPLARRFGFFLGRECEVECLEADRPLTAEKLRQHGIDAAAVGRAIAGVLAALARCDPDALTVKLAPQPNSRGSAIWRVGKVPMGDPRFEDVHANLFKGQVYVTLWGPTDKTPAPEQAGVDWAAFQAAAARLLRVFNPPGIGVTFSGLKRSTGSPGRWVYQLKYALAAGT